MLDLIFMYKAASLILISFLFTGNYYFNINYGYALGDAMKQVKTVEYVDLKRYMGKWYEIAKIPNRFQRNCVGNTTANYTLLESGYVKVVNSCLEDNGRTKTAVGIARVTDKETSAKLKVSFFSIFGIHLFWGNYWVLYIDEDYENVIVSEPGRKYGWILSRKASLTKEELKPLYTALENNGYNPGSFEHTRQDIKD